MPRRKMLRRILGRAREDCVHTQRWSPQEGVLTQWKEELLRAGRQGITSRSADSIVEDRKSSGQLPPRSQPSRSLMFLGLGAGDGLDCKAELGGGNKLIWVCARGQSPRSSSVSVFTR